MRGGPKRTVKGRLLGRVESANDAEDKGEANASKRFRGSRKSS